MKHYSEKIEVSITGLPNEDLEELIVFLSENGYFWRKRIAR